MVDKVLKGDKVEDIPVKVFKDVLIIYVNNGILDQLEINLPDSFLYDNSYVLL